MTFDEFMFMCKQAGLHPYVEPKFDVLNSGNVASLVNIIKKYGMLDRTTVLSASYEPLQLIKNESNRLRFAYSTGISQEKIDELNKQE